MSTVLITKTIGKWKCKNIDFKFTILYNGGEYMDARLFNILRPYESWFNNDGKGKNKEAKKALYRFYEVLLEYKPSLKKYEKRNIGFHTSYLRSLIEIKKAIEEEKYQRACNELVSLMYYEPFFQGRIYFNVLDLLEKKLGIGGNKDVFSKEAY